MIWLSASAASSMEMETTTWDSGAMAKHMAAAYTSTRWVASISVTGRMTNKMDMARRNGPMNQGMKAASKKARKTAQAFSNGPMVPNM